MPGIDPGERAAVLKRSVSADSCRFNRAAKRIDEIEPAAVGRHRGPVRDRDFVDHSGQLAAIEAVKGAGFGFLAIVHRSEPQPAGRIDDAVVQAIAGPVGLDLDDQLKVAGALVETMEPGFEARDESAALRGEDEADGLGRGPAIPLPVRRIVAVDRMLLDVDEPQRLVALDPDRPFAELRRETPCNLGCD